MKKRFLKSAISFVMIFSFALQIFANEATLSEANKTFSLSSTSFLDKNTPTPSIVNELKVTQKTTFEIDGKDKNLTENKNNTSSNNNQNNNLNDDFKTQINLLNYLTVVTQDIKQTKNRMLLDDTYNALYNSMHLEAIDNKTQGYTKNLADIIFSLKMSKIKRERIEFILEQEKASAMKQAIPNPVALLSSTQAKSKYKLLASIAYMVIDSIAGYNAAISNANMDYLKSGWEIDDNELADINTLNGLLWDYKNEMRREYNIPSDLILNEEKIIDFVKNKNYDNIDGKILFLRKIKILIKAILYYG